MLIVFDLGISIVNVESTGQYDPEELVPEAIKLLLGKVKAVEEGLDKLFVTHVET